MSIARKALIEALVAQVKITGPGRIVPCSASRNSKRQFPGRPLATQQAPRRHCERRCRWSCNDQFGGGGGIRTLVLRYITRASPGAACCGFLSPGSHAGELPTGLSRCELSRLVPRPG
jgi:hypothetical protein